MTSEAMALVSISAVAIGGLKLAEPHTFFQMHWCRQEIRPDRKQAPARGGTEGSMSWETMGIFLIFVVAVGALNLAAIRMLFKQHEIGNQDRLDALRREGTDYSHAIKHELSVLKSELPIDYVLREDWIRLGALIDAKLDIVRRDLESVRQRLYGQS
jgi:hypothetical protein